MGRDPVDGFGFGTLAGESCLKNVHCHTDRASWDAILVTQSHSFGLGRVGGGGIPLGGGGGGGGGRRTENRDHIYIYIYILSTKPPNKGGARHGFAVVPRTSGGQGVGLRVQGLGKRLHHSSRHSCFPASKALVV